MSRRQRAAASTTKTIDGREVPGWFDQDKHRLTANGIFSVSTGHMLAADGHPQSGPARARSLAAAGETNDALGLVADTAVAAAASRLRAAAPLPETETTDAGTAGDSTNAGTAGEQGE